MLFRSVDPSDRCLRCWQTEHRVNACSHPSVPVPFKPNFISRSNMLERIYMTALALTPSTFAAAAAATATSFPPTPFPQISILETCLDTSKKLYSADGVSISRENNWLAPDNPHHLACHICLYYGHSAEQCLNVDVDPSDRCLRCWQTEHRANVCSRPSVLAPFKPNFMSRPNMLQRIYIVALTLTPATSEATATATSTTSTSTATATATTSTATNRHN